MFHPHPNQEKIQQLFDRQLAIEEKIKDATNAINKARAKKSSKVKAGEYARSMDKVIAYYSIECSALERERAENSLRLKQMDKEMISDTFDTTIGEYLQRPIEAA